MQWVFQWAFIRSKSCAYKTITSFRSSTMSLDEDCFPHCRSLHGSTTRSCRLSFKVGNIAGAARTFAWEETLIDGEIQAGQWLHSSFSKECRHNMDSDVYARQLTCLRKQGLSLSDPSWSAESGLIDWSFFRSKMNQSRGRHTIRFLSSEVLIHSWSSGHNNTLSELSIGCPIV
jgi:hypothetical protein